MSPKFEDARVKREQNKSKPNQRWTEQWDMTFMKNTVNVPTGQSAFQIPLIDTTIGPGLRIQYAMTFDSQKQETATALGNGWSLYPTQDFIFVDYQKSIYLNDAKFYLMESDGARELNRTSPITKTDRAYFELPGKSDIEIVYNLETQIWTIDTAKERTSFGERSNKQKTLSWKYWRGSGTNVNELQSLPLAWYITERFSKFTGQCLKFYYDIDATGDPNYYTEAVRLVEITDNVETSLVFGYNKISDEEYLPMATTDSYGRFELATQMPISYYITEYWLETPVYQQKLKFEYQMKGNKRFLTAFDQIISDSQTERIFNFDYTDNNGKYTFSKFTFNPYAFTVKYEHKPFKIESHSETITIPVRETPSINPTGEFTVVSYKDAPNVKKIIIQIYTPNFATLKAELSAFDSAVDAPIEDYQLYASANIISLLIHRKEYKELCAFYRNAKKWEDVPDCISFRSRKEATIAFNGRFLLVSDSPNNVHSSLGITDYTENRSSRLEILLEVPKKIKRLALDNLLIAGYDGTSTWVIFRSSDEQIWQHKKVGTDKDMLKWDQLNKKTIGLFDLELNFENTLNAYLNQNGIQVYRNSIALTAIEERNGQLYTRIGLILLDAHYNMQHYQEVLIPGEIITQISLEDKIDGSIYKIKYENQSGYFRVTLESIKYSQKIEEEINKIVNSNRRDDERKRRWDMDLGQIKKKYKSDILFNIGKYLVHLSDTGVLIDDRVLLITGTEWESTPININSHPLGKDFVLESDLTDNKKWYLYKQGEDRKKVGSAEMEIILNAPGQLVNQFPTYFAYQSPATTVNVITFNDANSIGKCMAYTNEMLVTGNSQSLITIVGSDSASYELKVRSIATTGTVMAVTNVTTNVDGMTRVTAYERTSVHENGKYKRTVTEIPGGKKSISGWTTVSRLYDVSSRKTTTSREVFDADGVMVPMPPEESVDETETDDTTEVEESLNSDGMLWDQSGELLISNFMPYSLQDDTVAYFGFENYEANSELWDYKREHVVNQSRAFTGSNYLNLSGTFFRRTLIPRNQRDTYLASCWVVTSSKLRVSESVPILRVIIKSQQDEIITLKAIVKRKRGAWTYLELVLDFMKIRKIYARYLAQKDLDVTFVGTVIFSITLDIQPLPGTSLLLDHIRFSPITHDFKAVSYIPTTGKILSTLDENGLTTRILYDHLGRKITTTTESGHIDKLTTSTKTGQLLNQPLQRSSMYPMIRIKLPKLPTKEPCRLTFQPESGFHETFDYLAWKKRWKSDDLNAWITTENLLRHPGKQLNRLTVNQDLFDPTSAAVRFFYSLESTNSAFYLKWLNEFTELRFTQDFDGVQLRMHQTVVEPLPTTAELIVMVDNSRISIWIDSVLVLDEKVFHEVRWSSFVLDVKESVSFAGFIVMNRPTLKIEYFNGYGEITQTIRSEDEDTALVQETLYDELGRDAIKTKLTRIVQNVYTNPIYAKYENFVDGSSVWKTGVIGGLLSKLNDNDGGYPYERIEYFRNPLKENRIVGLPGQKYAINGPFAKHYSHNANIKFLSKLFPIHNGFYETVEKYGSGNRIYVYDQNKNKVAKCMHVVGQDHTLTIYEYDQRQRLVKILPPLYHAKKFTLQSTTAWQSGDDHLSPSDKDLQKKLGIHMEYNDDDYLIKKSMPDSGVTEYKYTLRGQMSWMIFKDHAGKIVDINYFYYDSQGQLTSTGYLTNTTQPINSWANVKNREYLAYAQDYQQFYYTERNPDPEIRGRGKRIITNSVNASFIDTLTFDGEERIILKSTIGTLNCGGTITNVFNGKHLSILTYPKTDATKEPLRLLHTYNKLGQLKSIGTPDDPNHFVTFTYTPGGMLSTENYQQKLYKISRNYTYNSPGFLKQIADPFFTETLFYTTGGYGQNGFGDGVVMRTDFNATWLKEANFRQFQLNENSAGPKGNICIRALKRTGYLSALGMPLKPLNTFVELSFPVQCHGEMGRKLMEIMGKNLIPKYYGHRYAYGDHEELVKAKYFTESNDFNQLHPESFVQENPRISLTESRDIFQKLSTCEYFRTNLAEKSHVSIFNDNELRQQLNSIDSKFTIYIESIKQLLTQLIGARKKITAAKFTDYFLNWTGYRDDPNPQTTLAVEQKNAQRIYENVVARLDLSSDFRKCLSKYANYVPEIVKTLTNYLLHELGKNPFDVKFDRNDANGNHELMFIGFERHQLLYDINRMTRMKILKYSQSEVEILSPMQYDSRGNVIRSHHNGILQITYHPVSQRTLSIRLKDERMVRFFYDAAGERVLKRVFNGSGTLTHETHYMRNEQGRVLMDQRIDCIAQKITTTTYLYGPRGLFAFIRNNEFHNVITDHAGSVRLVVKNNRVVAAYDYYPYGKLMRSYGNDPSVHISYRYTGQEYDNETGLYNFHARLYDPYIGQFYQPDTQVQFASPYKYAGNSPISNIDPNGELAFLIPILIGMYLGGAAINNRLNPFDWDYHDPMTTVGIIGGGLSGWALPEIWGSAVSYMGRPLAFFVGSTGSYLHMAQVGGWDPRNWKWTPELVNAGFQGFGSLLGAINTIRHVHMLAFEMGTGRKIIFLTASYSAAGGAMYAHGVIANEMNFKIWQLDIKNPATLIALIDGLDIGHGMPQNFYETGVDAMRFLKNRNSLAGLVPRWSKLKLARISRALKRMQGPAFQVLLTSLMTYYMASAANSNFKLDWSNNYSTYEAVLNGMFFGRSVSRTIAYTNGGHLITTTDADISAHKEVHEWLEASVGVFEDAVHTDYNHALEEIMHSKIKQEEFILKLDEEHKISAREYFKSGNLENVPANIENMLRAQSKLNIEASHAELVDLIDNTKKLYEELNEIDSENDKEFLLCPDGGKRRKRSGGPVGRPCKLGIIKEPIDDIATNKAFLSELYKKILDNNPKAHATNDRNFYLDYFLGSVAGLTKNKRIQMNVEKIYVLKPTSTERKNTVTRQKNVIIVTSDRVIVKKIIDYNREVGLAQKKKFGDEVQGDQSISKEIIDDIVDPQRREDIRIDVETLIIDKTKQLESTHQILEYQNLPDSLDRKLIEMTASVHDNGDFLKILGDKHDAIEDKVKAMKSLTQNMLDLYATNMEILSMDKAKNKPIKEAQFHAFMYGVLSTNYKENHGLDIGVERTVGKGYVDLMFIARFDGESKRNWFAIPVIYELKANFDHAQGAIDQIHDTGYLYNLSMRTIANEAIIISVNSVTYEFIAHSVKIPKPEGFVDKLTAIIPRADHIEAELQHLYYSVPNLSFKTKSPRRMSAMIIGHFLSRPDIKECFVKHHEGTSPTSLLFQGADENWVLLNLLEEVTDKSPTQIDIPKELQIEAAMTKIDISINALGEQWKTIPDSSSPSPTDHDYDFFRGIAIGTNVAPVKVENSHFKKMNTINLEDFGKTVVSYKAQDQRITKFFRDLSAANDAIYHFLKSESDVQLLIQGIFQSNPEYFKNKVVKIFPEPTLGAGGRTDLIIAIYDPRPTPVELQFLCSMELKFDVSPPPKRKTGVDAPVNDKTSAALKQGKAIKNLRAITDSDEILIIGATYLKRDNTFTMQNDLQNVDTGESVPRPRPNDGDEETPAKRPHTQSVQSSAKQLGREKRAALSVFEYDQLSTNRTTFQKMEYKETDLINIPTPGSKFNNLKSTMAELQCLPGVWDGRQYNMNGITCNLPNYRVNVFVNSSPYGLQYTTSAAISTDIFKKSTCKPIEFSGRPSVTCTGEKTSIVYTPYLPERPGELLDGQIMLSRILFHVANNLWKKWSRRHSTTDDNIAKAKVAITMEQKQMWRANLDKLQTTFVEMHVKLGSDTVKWAEPLLLECHDIGGRLMQETEAEYEEIEMFTERIMALKEDLTELITEDSIAEGYDHLAMEPAAKNIDSSFADLNTHITIASTSRTIQNYQNFTGINFYRN